MMDDDFVQLKILRRILGNQTQLMLRHRSVNFVIDPVDFTSVFHFSNNTPKIDNRSGRRIINLFRRGQTRLRQ